jgi:phage head maturation protease
MGLSIGFLPVDVDVVNGERVVRSVVLEEVSIVRDPAWPDCVITEVEEVISWPRTLAHT